MSRLSTGNTKLVLADVKPAGLPASVPAGHPWRNQRVHRTLMSYVISRMERGAEIRETRVERFKTIDKQIYGWIKLDTTEQQRKNKKDATGQPLATDQHFPLALSHLEDAVSYYAGVFAPTRGMFSHVGDAAAQEAGEDFLKVMNQHAQHAGYYRQMMRALLDIHKYQMGGLTVEWDVQAGNEVIRQPDGTLNIEQKIVWEGNRLKAMDVYNSFWQPGVEWLDVATKSEFYAEVRLTNFFEIQKNASAGVWVNTEASLAILQEKNQPSVSARGRTSFYIFPPAELRLSEDSLARRSSEWSFMSESGVGALSTNRREGLFELSTVYIWLNPMQHGLIAVRAKENVGRNRLELWKLEILDGQWLVSAEHSPNAHAQIPLAPGTLGNDSLGEWQKSQAEILRPLQDFLSFILNTHIKGVRKNLWGLTIYNKEIVDLEQIPEGEIAARVAANPTGQDLDLSKAIYHDNQLVDTKQNISDFNAILGIVNQLYPTQALPSQVAGIDRAVSNQVAAVVQGGNRPLQAKARFIDETMLRNMRTLLYFNILQFQTDDQVVDSAGNEQPIDLEKLQDVKLQYLLGQGLKALDKQTVTQQFESLIFALLQSPAVQEVDVLALLNAFSDYLDIDIDLTRFQKQTPETSQTTGVDGDSQVSDATSGPPEVIPQF